VPPWRHSSWPASPTAAAGEAVRVLVERKASHYEAQALEVLAGIAEQSGQIDVARQALERVVHILRAAPIRASTR
jgi:hypothetical protein